MISFNFITPRLATGGGPHDPEDIERLVQSGITHTIDCTWEEADQTFSFAVHPAISCLWNPTEDDGRTKDPSWFQQSVDFALMALSKPNTKVYAHCWQGCNRGPSTAFAILLTLGWKYDEAIDLIHEKRPITKGQIKGRPCIYYAPDAANGLKELGYLG